MNFLGLDYGESKVGVSFAPGGILAVGMKILPNDKDIFDLLTEIIRENEVGCIVIGLPVSMDGSQSSRTQKTLKFIQKIKERLPSVLVEASDERLSTAEAKRNLAKGEEDDAEAARIILQSFLDRRK